MSERPMILISSCHNAQSTGDNASNGGLKVYNNFANLLIEHGYDAYVVTWTGERIDWLIHHAPYVSIDMARQWKAEGRPLKYMTGWWWSDSFLELADRVYYYDCELAFTSEYSRQRGLLEAWMQSGRIAKLATHSRTQQAYYMATYGITPQFIPEWSSSDWQPCEERRVRHRIGFLNEGDHTYRVIGEVQAVCARSGLFPEFMEIGGSEGDVLEAMQTCDLYLGLNIGKHEIWGEGCPRGQQEAQHAGAIVIAFDVHGNAEYLFDGYNGYMVSIGDVDAMAGRVVGLLEHDGLRERMRERSLNFAQLYFVAHRRWGAVKDFLDLND